MKLYRPLRYLTALLMAAVSAIAADLSAYQGTWIITGGEFDGNAIGNEFSSGKLTVEGSKYIFELGDVRAKGTFTIDSSKTPAVMMVNETEGPNAGRTIAAITESTPKGWQVCYSPAGNSEPPKAFSTAPGSGLFLARYEREPGTAVPAVKPLKVLLVLGGCCHDYATQKELLKRGIEGRANAIVDIIYSPDASTKPPLPIYGKPQYADGYDIVVHDECSSDINDAKIVEGVLKPHRDGTPAVNLHCAMHSYRIGNPNQPAEPATPHAMWFEYLGLQSSGHGPQRPISLSFVPEASPITAGLTNWTTMNEELYNNIKVWDSAKSLARGKQDPGDKPGQNDCVIVWTHEYGPKKTRVFSTTIGHNNGTVGDPRYLDLVTRGLLWACDKLSPTGQPVSGYAAGTQ